ncbi:MAG: T9SS type A sorting domain-containing protein [Candidatus Kapabacteria bacterium]|nr:T9SS type A sorting domain-containing protein [Ignavibacteriota bacterium]MCW5885532.1 T9SS type A sorting domain-containing protein [Candidatus Kapabacteria bacterium]
MKRLNYLLVLLTAIIIAVSTSTNLLAQPVHFTFTTTDAIQAMTILVPTAANPKIGDTPLANGDEIGVFVRGFCVGASVWNGTSNITITVWPESQGVPGAKPGDLLSFRVWDHVEDIEYSSVTVQYTEGAPFFSWDGNFAISGFSGLSSLVGAKKPGKPTFTNPTNNQEGVALNGSLTWNAAQGANTHTVQLSTVNTFASTILNTSGNFTSIPYSALSHNTTYFARALGTNDEGDGDWETISFKTLLATPTLISPADAVKGLNEGSVTLSWNGVAGATSYDVEISTSPDFTANLATAVTSNTSINLPTLNNFTQYYWRVKAKDGGNTSAFSTSRNFTTRVGTTTITNPANNATGVAVSGNLEWTAVSGATSYDVQLVKSPSTVIFSVNVAATQTGYSNLVNFSDYIVRVTARNADGIGDMVTGNFRTILGVPTLNAPANNSFNAPLSGNISWNAVSGATDYDYQIATDAGFNTIVASNNGVAGLTAAYAGFVNNTKYYWRARANNAEGTSAYSSAFAFTTLLGNVTLATPANNATQVSLNPTLTWNALEGATNYHLQVSTNSGFTAIVYENTAVGGTSQALTNLNGKTNYFWRVKGYNANNEGGFSSTFLFTTELSKVNLTSPANGAQGIIAASGTLNWQAQGGATGYDLLVSKNSNLSSPVINTSTVSASYNYAGLDNDATYYWAVRSKDSEGVGPYSDTWSFGTQIPAPTLLTPANGAVNVVLQGNATWNAVAGATSYEIQIATDAAFTNILFQQSGINGTTVAYTGLDNAKLHYWRVRGYKNAGAGFWSGTFTFTTMSLAAPNLVFPSNNSIDLYSNVTLVWGSVNDATGYNVRIATDPNFINVVAQGNNLGTTSFDVTSLFTNRDFYWQAQTIGLQGTSNWSDAFTFRTLHVPVINGEETVCETRTYTYSTNVSPLVDYQWSVTGGTIVGSSTGTSVTVAWGAAGAGTVKLTRSSAVWGSYTDSKTLNVTKEAIDDVVITITAHTHFENKACPNEVVSFTSSLGSAGTFSYVWTLNGNIVSTTDGFDYRFTTTGNQTIVLTVEGDGCEGGSKTLVLNVDENCPVTILNDDNVYACKGDSPQLMTNVFGGSGQFTYAWSPAADFVNATVESPIVISSNFAKSFTLTVKDVVTNLQYTDILYLLLKPTPNVTFTPTRVNVYNANPVDLTDPGFVTVNITNGTAPFDYFWRYNNGTPISDPTEVYPVLGTNNYFLYVADANGCKSEEKRFRVVRYPSKLIGEILTGLNGDGIVISYPNPVVDELNIFAEFETESNARLRIVNLLGQEVFSQPLGSISIYDGSFNLSHLSSGAYTLIVETDTDMFVKTFIKY